MTKEEFERLLDSMATGWAQREFEKVASYFSENLFYSDSLNYTYFDRASLLQFFNSEDQEERCSFHDSIFDEARQVGVAEYTYEGTNRYHGTVWIELDDDKIVSWREYQHKVAKSWEEFWDRR